MRKNHSIVAVNDGGMIIRYYPSSMAGVNWQPGGIRTVFGIEVKWSNGNNEHSRTDQTHACKVAKFDSDWGPPGWPNLLSNARSNLLSWILRKHSEWISRGLFNFILITEDQAFTLHCRHTTMVIYYAKLPNSYLKDIVHLGADYASKRPNVRVELRRTRKFYMKKNEDCVELFGLFARLLTYLASGESHVGYLYNYEGNPIHEIVLFSFLNTHVRENATFQHRHLRH